MTDYKIDLTASDGAQFAFTCGADETLSRAAERQGLLFPTTCRQGGCGACRADVRAGDYRLDAYTAEALAPEAAKSGGVLLCRTRPQSDLSLTAPFAGAMVRRETIPERTVEVVSCAAAGEGAIHLILRHRPDDPLGVAAQFDAGQFMELSVADGATRAYSLANISNWDGLLEFLIRLRPGGAVSAALAAAQPGDHVTVRGPLGDFRLRDGGLAPRWFVAGGTGLAPVLSMLRHMAEFGESQPARLFFGVNRPAELFGLELIAETAAALPQLESQICVWTAEGDWSGPVGSPVDLLTQALAAYDGPAPEIYVCGPPALIAAVRTAAEAAGLGDQVIAEAFSAGA